MVTFAQSSSVTMRCHWKRFLLPMAFAIAVAAFVGLQLRQPVSHDPHRRHGARANGDLSLREHRRAGDDKRYPGFGLGQAEVGSVLKE